MRCSKRPLTVPAKCGSPRSKDWAAWGTRRASRGCWRSALESDAELAAAAKQALADLPGQDVDKDIVARLHGAQGKIYPLLIELVGERRVQAVPDLVKALDDSDKTVRSAALDVARNDGAGRSDFRS